MTRYSSRGESGGFQSSGLGSTPSTGSSTPGDVLWLAARLSSARLPQGLRGPKSAIWRRAMT